MHASPWRNPLAKKNGLIMNSAGILRIPAFSCIQYTSEIGFLCVKVLAGHLDKKEHPLRGRSGCHFRITRRGWGKCSRSNKRGVCFREIFHALNLSRNNCLRKISQDNSQGCHIVNVFTLNIAITAKGSERCEMDLSVIYIIWNKKNTGISSGVRL